jgi:hypothetical protein
VSVSSPAVEILPEQIMLWLRRKKHLPGLPAHVLQ